MSNQQRGESENHSRPVLLTEPVNQEPSGAEVPEKCLGRMKKDGDPLAAYLGGCLRCGLGACQDAEMSDANDQRLRALGFEQQADGVWLWRKLENDG